MPGKYLGLDVGNKRIGLAVCDPLGLAARPLLTVVRGGRDRDNWQQFAEIVRREEAVGAICGLPLNMDGTEGEQAQRTRRWAKRFAAAMSESLGEPFPVTFHDERLSSFAADEILSERGLTGTVSQDAAAAAVILQSWLDETLRNKT